MRPLSQEKPKRGGMGASGAAQGRKRTLKGEGEELYWSKRDEKEEGGGEESGGVEQREQRGDLLATQP